MEQKKFKVVWKRKIEKRLMKCPEYVQEKFWVLVKDIEESGPVQKNWRNYSTLGKNLYHCHLDYSWVAVWYCEGASIIVEVTYVGSREDAPY